MFLFVGLGNPGPQYIFSRHNIGFLIADAIHRRYRFDSWREDFDSEMARGGIAGERILLLKPMTFMNDSGRAVAEAQHFFKIELGNVVVFHDEIDLPAAKVRVKIGGGDAGHNGLRSISEHCGNEYQRVRIGVGKPEDKYLVRAHVLTNFAETDRLWVTTVCEAIADAVDMLVEKRPEEFQNRVHLALLAKGILDDKPDEPA